MSKLLLIIDSDELNDDCLNCPVKYTYIGGVGCSIAHKDVDTESIPDWCSLRPLPEKKWIDPHDVDMYDHGEAYGWNACLEAITGGNHDETEDD